MIGFTIWLAITAGSVDVGGGVVLEVPTREWTAVFMPRGKEAAGITFPHVALVDPDHPPGAVEHEMIHLRQWDALGPGLLAGYLLGQGREFESYLADGSMWLPPPELRSCPLARFEFEAGFSVLPCWSWLWH